MQIQSIRGVGCVRGYPYYAWGVYEPRKRSRDGVWTWRLVRSGTRFRSDVNARWAFADIDMVPHIRHGTPLTSEQRKELEEECNRHRLLIRKNKLAELCLRVNVDTSIPDEMLADKLFDAGYYAESLWIRGEK